MFMLKTRSRAVTSKQNRMTDHSSYESPKQNQATSFSSFLGSPRLFNGFLTRTISDHFESAMSPTSILDSKNLSNLVTNPFGYDRNSSKLSTSSLESKHKYEKSDGIGLVLIDSQDGDEEDENLGNPKSKMILFGAKLNIQIPHPVPCSSDLNCLTPKSHADFGIKTRNSQFLMGSSSAFGSPNHSLKSPQSQAMTEVMSLSEMELSEDYTCVITHGPNPKTTHIFDDCIVKSCCGVGNLSDLRKEYYGVSDDDPTCDPVNFLKFCHTCNDKLGDGKQVYLYRGKKAFCSRDCRCKEMLVEGVKSSEKDEDE